MPQAVLILTLLFTHASAQAAGGRPHPGAVEVERTAYLMGTLLRVNLNAPDRDTGLAAADAVFAEVARLEAVLSSWTASSEVGRLNRAPAGERVRLSEELRSLLAESAVWVERTGGAFDPAVGALVDVWGLRSGGRRPSGAELDAALSQTGWSRADFDAAQGELARPSAGWWLDTGGFGKGAALRAAAAVLRAAGIAHATLDFGGQLLQLGAAGERARVAVADPIDRGRAVAVLRVADGSVATSSASERFAERNGERLGHVVDPRTGRPVPAWGSVTVVAQDALVADVLSTALFVMGADAALTWAAERDDVGVLVLETTNDGVAAGWNAAMDGWLEEAPARGRRASAHEREPAGFWRGQ